MTDDRGAGRDELRAVAREVLAKPGAPDRGTLSDLGWLGLELPARLHGSEATFGEVAVVLEELGRAASAVPYVGPVVLGVEALQLVAEDAVAEGQVRRVADGKVTYAVALDHTIGAAPPFRIERAGDRVRLLGEARFVPDATVAERLLLVALDGDAGPVVLDVPADLDGLSVHEQPLLDGSRAFAAVSAGGVDVHASAVRPFADEGEASLRRLHDRGALAVALDSLGLTVAMLDATVTYAKERHQFGRPIGSFQAVKHALADVLVAVTVGRELVDAAVDAIVAADADAWVPVSMAKAHVTGAAVDAVGKAMQLHGGIGYTWESGVHVYLKRATLNRSLFGSPAAHRRRLATRYA